MNRCPEEHKIVVRGLPSGISQSDVEQYFNRIGRVMDIWIKDTGRDSFGFVGFESKSDYEEALKRDGEEFEGNRLHIEPKGLPRGRDGPAPSRDGRDANKVYVRGVGDAPDDEIRSFFEKVGAISDFYRRDDADFCFIGFENAQDHERALRLNGEDFSGRRLLVEQKGGRSRNKPLHRSDHRRDHRRRRSSTPRRRRDSRSPPRRPGRDSRSPPRRPGRDSRSPPRGRYGERSRSPKRTRRSYS